MQHTESCQPNSLLCIQLVPKSLWLVQASLISKPGRLLQVFFAFFFFSIKILFPLKYMGKWFPQHALLSLYSFLKKKKQKKTTTDFFSYINHIFIYLFGFTSLSCGMQDLVPWPQFEPGPPALGAWILTH